jgi:hypothetical protein
LARRFVSEFLLPLVHGGTVEVSRPLSRRRVEALARAHAESAGPIERRAAKLLGRSRQRALASLVASPPRPELDEATWRIGAAVHNLLALGHPEVGGGRGAELRIDRVATAAAALARLGAPATVGEALARHSMLARLPELVRTDSVVRFWLGRMTFVGRPPPPRVLAFPRLRGIEVETTRRVWMRDVGVPAAARGAFLALTEASPLGEALDPLRLDPPLAWGRVLTVLRFREICRAVAGRHLEIGVARAGDALAAALFRFAAFQDPPAPVRASPDAVAFVLGFLAHIVWLDLLFGHMAPDGLGGTGGGGGGGDGGGGEGSAGRELAVVLAAAAEVRPALLWPADVPPDSDAGRRFSARLAHLAERYDVARSPRWPAALEVAQLAVHPGAEVMAPAVER